MVKCLILKLSKVIFSRVFKLYRVFPALKLISIFFSQVGSEILSPLTHKWWNEYPNTNSAAQVIFLKLKLNPHLFKEHSHPQWNAYSLFDLIAKQYGLSLSLGIKLFLSCRSHTWIIPAPLTMNKVQIINSMNWDIDDQGVKKNCKNWLLI